MMDEPGSRPALNLPQAVLVLAIGRGVAPGAIERSLAGAVLLELIERGCLSDDDGRLVAAAGARPADELLADSLALLRASLRPREAGWWIERLPRELAPLRERVARPLVERGVVPHERSLFSGPYGGIRFPERDPAPERQLRERLAGLLLGERDPLGRDVLLVALLRSHGLERGLVPADRGGEATRRAAEIAARDPGSEAARGVLSELGRRLSPGSDEALPGGPPAAGRRARGPSS